jgi:hypothetical protein
MVDIMAAQCDHFFVAMDRGFVVFVTVVTEQTLHQPGFGMVWIDIENPIKKDLGDLPPFFRNRSSGVTPIDANHRVIVVVVCSNWRFEHCDCQHFSLREI